MDTRHGLSICKCPFVERNPSLMAGRHVVSVQQSHVLSDMLLSQDHMIMILCMAHERLASLPASCSTTKTVWTRRSWPNKTNDILSRHRVSQNRHAMPCCGIRLQSDWTARSWQYNMCCRVETYIRLLRMLKSSSYDQSTTRTRSTMAKNNIYK